MCASKANVSINLFRPLGLLWVWGVLCLADCADRWNKKKGFRIQSYTTRR